MKRNREVLQGTDIYWIVSEPRKWEINHPPGPKVSIEISKKANYLLELEISSLYCPNVYVIPTTVSGEVYREMLYVEYDISRYGCYEYTLNHNSELYTIILVNND